MDTFTKVALAAVGTVIVLGLMGMARDTAETTSQVNRRQNIRDTAFIRGCVGEATKGNFYTNEEATRYCQCMMDDMELASSGRGYSDYMNTLTDDGIVDHAEVCLRKLNLYE